MSTAAYAVRQISYTFQIGIGQFGGGGSTTLTLPIGLRSQVHVEFANLPHVGTATMRIYGVSLDHMNQISKAGLVYAGRRNFVTIQAGDAAGGMTTIFKGNILEAYPDMNGQPSTPLYVFATGTNDLQLAPVPPVSFTGATAGSQALQKILSGAGVALENNGVTGILSAPYFPGTVWSQVLSCVRSLGCYAHYDVVANVLAIWPKDGARAGAPVDVSPARGLLGYPSFQAQQVTFRMLFDPAISPALGRIVNMQSGLVAADGKLRILGIDYDLSAQVPKGPWEMLITSNPVNVST